MLMYWCNTEMFFLSSKLFVTDLGQAVIVYAYTCNALARLNMSAMTWQWLRAWNLLQNLNKKKISIQNKEQKVAKPTPFPLNRPLIKAPSIYCVPALGDFVIEKVRLTRHYSEMEWNVMYSIQLWWKPKPAFTSSCQAHIIQGSALHRWQFISSVYLAASQ